MKTDGIIFDMDGTLWDTCKIVADSWTAALRDAGVEKVFSVEMIRSCMGLMMEEFAAKCMPEIETAQRLFYLKKCFEYENKYLRQHGGLLFSGVTETLAALKEKYPLFIVSNCQDGYIEAFFAGNDTGHFLRIMKIREGPAFQRMVISGLYAGAMTLSPRFMWVIQRAIWMPAKRRECRLFMQPTALEMSRRAMMHVLKILQN